MIAKWLQEMISEDGRYLWPHTPIGNIQAEIWRRAGASDWNISHVRCRPRMIIETLRELIRNDLLPQSFTALDLCCGDGVVLLQIRRAFVYSMCYGIDLLTYPTHAAAEKMGVMFHRVPLQKLVEAKPPNTIDVCIMLNTFRGWDKADLQSEDCNLPSKTIAWMRSHCRYIFITATEDQKRMMMENGWFIWKIGKGEDDSNMYCAFPCEGPEGPTGRWRL